MVSAEAVSSSEIFALSADLDAPTAAERCNSHGEGELDREQFLYVMSLMQSVQNRLFGLELQVEQVHREGIQEQLDEFRKRLHALEQHPIAGILKTPERHQVDASGNLVPGTDASPTVIATRLQVPASVNVASFVTNSSDDLGTSFNTAHPSATAGTSTAPLSMPSFLNEWTRSTYKPQKSVWDVSMFIGTSHVSSGASYALTACLLLNLGLVTMFLVASRTVFSQPQFDEISRDDFHFWRTTVAHDVSYRNPLTGESLASGVCRGLLSLPFSNLQSMKKLDLTEYLDVKFSLFSSSTGFLMCSLALFVWHLTLLAEFREIVDATCSQLRIRYDPSNTMVVLEGRDSLRLSGMSHVRKIIMLLFQCLRIAVCFLLGWYGTWFLIYTVSLEDLLLNAVALDVVLKLDDLIFTALAPLQAHVLIDKLLPLKLPRHRKAWHSFGESLVLFLIIGVGFMLSQKFMLAPYIDVLTENEQALCGGHDESSLNFVVAIDAVGIPWAAPTMAGSENLAARSSYTVWVIEQAKESGFPPQQDEFMNLQPMQRFNMGLVMQAASADDLVLFEADQTFFGYPKDYLDVQLQQLGDVVGWSEVQVLGPNGTDFGDAIGTVYNNFLRYILEESGNVTCAQVPDAACNKHGSSASAAMMRQLCPHRCGCTNPLHGTASNPLARNAFFGFPGCAHWNLKTRTYQDALDEMPCRDTTDRSKIVAWASGLDHAKEDVVASFDAGGCAAVATHDLGEGLASKICSETSGAILCPESCGCNASVPWKVEQTPQHHFCPFSCGRAQPACFTTESEYISQYVSYKAGYPCIFPFTYQGTEHHNCTDDDWYVPWCAVTVQEDGIAQTWGDCDANC